MSIYQREKKRAGKVIHVGILPAEARERRAQAIERGLLAPAKDEPTVWFESRLSMEQVLSPENRELLLIVHRKKLQSLAGLEAATGRTASNVARALKTLARYGVVEIVEDAEGVRTVVRGTRFEVTVEADAGGVVDTRKRFDRIRDKAREAGSTRGELERLVKRVRRGGKKAR